MKIVLVGDDGLPVAEIEDLEQYDLSNTRGRAMLIDDIVVALGQADRRRVLEFMRDNQADRSNGDDKWKDGAHSGKKFAGRPALLQHGNLPIKIAEQ